MRKLIESTEEKDVYETPHGHLEVYKKGKKEGTSKHILNPDLLPPQPMRLKKKYRNQI